MIQEVYVLCYVHLECSQHQSPFNAIITSLTRFPMPCLLLPVTYAFHNGRLIFMFLGTLAPQNTLWLIVF